METEGPKGDGGREERGSASNVVHFPRDWFGPTDELVPFGPRASQTAVVELEEPALVRPDDFWGEGSAAIHDVLQAPEAGEAAAAVGAGIEANPGGHATRRRKILWPSIRSRRITRPRSALRVRARARRWSGVVRVQRPAVPRLQRRPVAVVAGGLAVAVCCAALVGRVEGPGGHHVVSASARADAQARESRGGRTSDAGAVLLALYRARATGRRAAAGGRSVRARPTGHVRRVNGGTPARHRGGGAPARQTGGGTPATPTYAATSQASGSAPVYPTASAAGGNPGSAGSGAGGSAAPAGPEGPGAPFGPGHLS